MISCKDCASLNSVDSAFCKKCGKPLAQEEAIDARELLEKQLDHGFELFHHGRTDEAWLNVESCLLADPENLRALSLKGMILERRGLIQEALDCYETIVARDPNAALERMKLQTLRGLLDMRKYQAPARDRRASLGIAVCAALLVISLVGAIVVSRGQKPETVALTPTTTPTYQVDSFPQVDNSKSTKQSDTDANGEEQPDGEQTQTNNPKSDSQSPQSRFTQATLNGALPDVTKLPESDPDFKPVNPLENARIQPMQTPTDQTTGASTSNGNIGGPTGDPQSSDPDPSTVNPSNDEKPKRQPVVDIKLSADQPAHSNEASMDSNGVEALVRTARGQYQVGSYQSAAATYEKALSAGADPAMTNQRLAQCYERLGRTSDAKAAYGRAISAIQDQINGGKGNKDRLLAALNSSQQALKNLGG